MRRRLLPPPPLIAPTPSKVRPAAVPLIVTEVAASAGPADATTAAVAARQSAARTDTRWRTRVPDMLQLKHVDAQESTRSLSIKHRDRRERLVPGDRPVPRWRILARRPGASLPPRRRGGC